MKQRGAIKISLRIKGREGKPMVELSIPPLDVVPLNRFIDFLVECRKFGDEGEIPVMIMARAISGFCDYPLAEIIEAEVGDVYNPQIRGLEGSVRSIFGYIASMVQEAKGEILNPENATFKHKGFLSGQEHTYHIPVIIQQSLKGEYSLPFMSVIEAVEAGEVQRFKVQKTQQLGDPTGFIRQKIMDVANIQASQYGDGDTRRLEILAAAEQVANIEIEKQGDPNGSLLYTMYLKLLAIIARREGEQLPFDDAEREKWINDRSIEFKGVSAQTALNVDFFLCSILDTSENTLPAVGFLTHQSFALAVEMQLKSKKPTTGRKGTVRRFSKG